MTATLDKATADDLDSIIRPLIVPPLADHEFTLSMLAERYDICRETAELIVKGLIRDKRAVFVGLRKTGKTPSRAYALTAKIKK